MPPLRPLAALFLTAASSLAAIDLDANGLDDVWAVRYHATALTSAGDADGDGATNADEALAGTDPFDPNSRLRLASLALAGPEVVVRLATQPGKAYRLQAAAALAGPWSDLGDPQPATAAELEFRAPREGARRFFRVEVMDRDSDGDGLTDWAELQLAGFDPQQGDSFAAGSAQHDFAVAQAMLQALPQVTAETTAAVAYEKEGTPAQVTYRRPTATPEPFTLFVRSTGPADPTKSRAGVDDCHLQTAAGAPIAQRIVIPAGETAVTVQLQPLADSKPEVPEILRLQIGGTALDTSLTVADAAPTPANQKLLVAYLQPSPQVDSHGGGLATLRLSGDNDLGTLAVSFSNLGSPVNSTQVVNASSSILQSIPPANYGGQPWAIRAGQGFTSDQATLDALLAGAVRLAVYTQAYVGGEIEGPFQPVNGSIEFQPPPPADPLPSLTGSELDRDLLRFLTQATYGPTAATFADLQTRVAAAGGDRISAYSAWIDEQFALSPTSLLAYTFAANRQEIEIRAALDPADPNFTTGFDPNNSNRRRGWWMLALNAPDQLPHRLAFALSQIFVISDVDSLVYERSYGSAHYYDMLRTKGAGSFRQLLEGVSTHPMMGYYLSHLRNQKAVLGPGGVVLTSPDENFAREIMQLFSIGLVQLHPDGSLKLGAEGLPIPTYGQTDITEMARVFTGWSFSVRNSPSASDTVIANTNFNAGNGSERYEAQWTNPMAMFPAYHDTAAKAPLGLSLPAGQTGEKDLSDVLDHLAAHPNTAAFISRRLIQRFVTANPSRGYLYRVANVFRTTNGNLPATVKAILLDPEARTPAGGASAGKVREPLLRVSAALRALDAKSQFQLADLSAYGYPAAELAKFPAGATRARISSTAGNLLQNFLSAPSVFNFFSPDYSPAGLLAANGIVSPELQIANDNSVIQGNNYLYNPIYSSSGLGATGLPNQTQPPYNYGASGQNLLIDFAPYDALYMAVVDLNHDGVFNSSDTGAHNNPTALRAACEAVLDRADLMLCAGALKARYGDTAGQPRRIILDAAVSIRSANNSSNSQQASVMRDRVRAILWLVLSSPESVVQS